MNGFAYISFVLIVLVVCLSGAQSQRISTGSCPVDQTFKTDFDAEKYVGRWFEIETYPSIFQASLKCVYAIYTPKSFGVIGVNNTGTNVTDNTVAGVVGVAYIPDPIDAPAKLVVSLSPRYAKGPYWVMDTDYTGYSVVYSCFSNGTHKTEFSWVLSRAIKLSDTMKQTVQAILQKNSINTEAFVMTSHEECAHHPDPHSNASGKLTFATELVFLSTAALFAALI